MTMRNIIFGGIGVLWGGGILLYSFLGGGLRAGGASGAGQVAGTIFGLLLFGVGLFYLVTGIRNLNEDDDRQPRRKSPKRKQRRIKEEDE
jgi:hypothetical protein